MAIAASKAGHISDLFSSSPTVPANTSAVLDAFTSYLFRNPQIEQIQNELHSVLLESVGPERQLIGRVYDVRVGKVEMFVLRQRNRDIGWKEAFSQLTLEKPPKRHQNVIRIHVSPILSRAQIAAGTRVRDAMEHLQYDGWLPNHIRPSFELLEGAFDILGWKTYQA